MQSIHRSDGQDCGEKLFFLRGIATDDGLLVEKNDLHNEQFLPTSK